MNCTATQVYLKLPFMTGVCQVEKRSFPIELDHIFSEDRQRPLWPKSWHSTQHPVQCRYFAKACFNVAQMLKADF